MVEYLIDLIKPPRKLRFCEKKNGEISAPLGCSVAAIVDTHFLLQEGTDSEVSSQADVKKKKKTNQKSVLLPLPHFQEPKQTSPQSSGYC